MTDELGVSDSGALVDRASRGDSIAVDELIERHLPGLRAYVRLRFGGMLRAKESASDVVQSACREVLGNLDRFRFGGEAGFKAWLYETAARKIADRAEYWKAERRDPAREAQPVAEPRPGASSTGAADARLEEVVRSIASPSQAAMGNETLERVERAFAQLSEADRE